MIRYFDASALVKRYVREVGSLRVRRLIASGQAATSRLSEAEVVSAFARRTREGVLTTSRRDRALAAFAADVRALIVVELTAEVAGLARQLLVRHALRAGDAVQLASCLVLLRALEEPVPMVAFDRRLVEAARAEGLTVEPNPARARARTRVSRSSG